MRHFLILLTFLISPLPLFGKAPSSPGRIAVVVNKSIITEGDLMNRLLLAATNAGIQNPTSENLKKMEQAMLRTMIDEKLQLQVAELNGIKLSDDVIKEAISMLEKNSGMAKGHIAKTMAENNIPLSTLEAQIRANRTWIEFIRAKYSPTIQIGDWEIAQELARQKEKDTKTQYHLAELVLLFDTPAQEKLIQSDLNRLMGELQKGAHFSALAQQFSQSPTAAVGGDMGWVTEDEVSPEVKNALSHMDPGQLSKPIRTSKSYVLIGYIEKKLPGTVGKTLVSLEQVLFPFPKNVTEDIAREIMGQAEKVSRAAKSCPDLETRAKALNPSVHAQASHDQVLETLPRALQDIIAKLPVNKATDPLLTEQGGLLFMVCAKRTKKAEPITEEMVRSQLAERKLQDLARRELRDFKQSSFIDARRPAVGPK